jgi:hypothetical protein
LFRLTCKSLDIKLWNFIGRRSSLLGKCWI